MVKYATTAILITEILKLATCLPTYGLHQDSPLTLNAGGGLGNYGHNGGLGNYGHNGGFVNYGHQAPVNHDSGIINNDHHGGVSVVGAGGSGHKGTLIDLTKEGGGGHDGLFGGSFVSSAKHESYLQGHDNHHGAGIDFNSGLGGYQSYHAAGEVTPVHYSQQSEHANIFAHGNQFEHLKNQEYSGLSQHELGGNYNFGAQYAGHH